jgi:PAS domain-containing protein
MKHTSRLFPVLLTMLTAMSAQAQPTFESASPTAGGTTSERANQMADKGMYKEVDYRNAAKKGPLLVVIPGEVKSNNATFIQKFGPNNIADFAELELGRANFGILERNDLGPLLGEFQLAYTMGDPEMARRMLQRGKFKTTQWVVKFDILKAEQVAQAQKGFDGQALGSLIGIFAGGRGGAAANTVGGSVQTGETTGVWIIGMRFKILDANTTEQKATGYTEEKMEVGATAQSLLGFSEGAKGGVSLDTMVQRLVQKLVWEIDAKYK